MLKEFIENVAKKADSLFPRCYICNSVLIGACLQDNFGNRICASHTDAHTCISCGRFCRKGSINVAENYYVCDECQKHHITESKIPNIENFIRAEYAKININGIPAFPIKLVDAATLTNLLQSKSQGFSLGLTSTSGNAYTVYALKYLTNTTFASVLAHEMLHVWQFAHGIYPRQDICEGFCNIGSYEILKAINTKVSQARILNIENDPSPTYGEGFRKVKRVYDQSGWQGVLAKIKKSAKSNP